MPSTSRWGLRYPALSDAPNSPAQMQTLAEDVDADLGMPLVLTSTTRPASPATGLHIYETDTGREFVWNGTPHGSTSAAGPIPGERTSRSPQGGPA